MSEREDESVADSATMAAPTGGGESPGHTVVGHAANARPSEPVMPGPGSEPPASRASAVIRAGGPRDYSTLVPVDPKHFVLGKEIARGGMGRILVARDRRLGRDVAIKELLATTGDLVARFEREARITARLQHPAIVNILEAGTWPGGEPFYVMKLVDGQSLDKAIAARKTVAERLALLPMIATVVDALACAHDKRIIHRDLKPANVLVGSFGEIVVIDWGLAKDLTAAGTPGASATDFGQLYRDSGNSTDTVVGAVMGTPSYMPAEQALGNEVDERADVYALGAMLYHLLTGTAPYTGKVASEILTRVIAGEVRPIAQLVADVPSDLVTIVNKAMAHDAADRYPTAKELADDLRRFQTGQLVGAHRYTAGERVRRFARRYRIQLTVTALALAAIGVVAGVSVNKVVNERDAAVAARTEADTQRAAADEHRRRADTERAAAEDVVGFILHDLKPGLSRIGQLPLMRGIAKQVDAYYEHVSTVDALDAAAKSRRADALSTLGDVFDQADDDPGARRAHEAALVLLGDRPDGVVGRARARLGIVIAMVDTGDLKGANGLIDTALAELDKTSEGTVYRGKLLRYRGIIQLQQGKRDEALASYGTAIDALSAAIAKQPGARELRSELAKIYDRRFDAKKAGGDFAGSLADANAGLAIRQALNKEDPGDVEIQRGMSVSYSKLYSAARSANKIEDAAKFSAAEIAIAHRLVENDPANLEWQRALFSAAEHASDVDYQLDHFDAAYDKLKEPIAEARSIIDASDNLLAKDDYATMMCHAADDLNQTNVPAKVDAGLELGKRCLEIEEQLHARVPDNLDYYRGVGVAHERLGDSHAQKNEWQLAVDEYRQRVAVDEDLSRKDKDNSRRAMDLASDRFNLSNAILHLPNHRAEGIELMQKTVDELHALAAAGKLSAEFEAALPDYDKVLAGAKAGH